MEFSVVDMFADYATDGFYIDYSVPDKITNRLVVSYETV